jgi:hypothetical protein
MRSIPIFSILIATASSLLAIEQEDPRFTQWMQNSRTAFANNHLIAYVKLESLEGKSRSAECRYDRYPEKVERIQTPSGLTYARKKGKKWIQSDDWGESGKPPPKDRIQQLDDWVAYVDIPLRTEKPETRDKSQGAIVVRLVNQSTTEDRDEEFVFEQGREKQTSVNYPKFTFLKYKNSKLEDAILYKFSGPIYSGSEKVQMNIQYGLMIAVKMEMATPAPSKSEENSSDDATTGSTKAKSPSLTLAGSSSLPAPVSKEKVTFQQIDQQKNELKDKIVLLEITLIGKGGDIGNGMLRYFAEDTSGSAMPYGRVDFPRDALKKLGRLDKPKKGPVSVYARVHVFGGNAAAIGEAVGTKFSTDAHGKAIYEW